MQQQNKVDALNSSDESEMEINNPNNTIYISNLNEKINIEELKHVLEQVFSQFGNVIQVIAKKNIKMKGQAFVIFDDLSSSSQALEQLQGKVLFDKKMRLNYALEQSDIISKRDGTYIEKNLRVKKEIKKKKEKKNNKKQKQQEIQQIFQQSINQQNLSNNQQVLPNKILFVEDLPTYIDQDILNEIFGSYQGFIEVRHIQAKNLAFVEFAEEIHSIVALNELNNKSITSEFTLHISFAKK